MKTDRLQITMNIDRLRTKSSGSQARPILLSTDSENEHFSSNSIENFLKMILKNFII